MSTPINCIDAPAHYNQGAVECVDAMESAFGKERLKIFCTLQAFRYVWRCHDHEDGYTSSMRKASWFIHKALQLDRASQPSTPRMNEGSVGWEKY